MGDERAESRSDDEAIAKHAVNAAVPGKPSVQDETMDVRDLDETEEAFLRRRAAGNAVDDNAASHQGGMGSQGGQADFGSAGNLSGYDKSGL